MALSILGQVKETLLLKTWSFFKVPLINFVGPRVKSLDDKSCSVLIPLRYLTKNHFNSLYISAQVTGADLCAGLLAMHHTRKRKQKLSFIFKDLRADFKKRPDSDTLFTCKDGNEIKALIAKTISTKKRQHKTVTVIASCPKKYGDTVMAEFQLTLSMKASS